MCSHIFLIFCRQNFSSQIFQRISFTQSVFAHCISICKILKNFLRRWPSTTSAFATLGDYRKLWMTTENFPGEQGMNTNTPPSHSFPFAPCKTLGVYWAGWASPTSCPVDSTPPTFAILTSFLKSPYPLPRRRKLTFGPVQPQSRWGVRGHGTETANSWNHVATNDPPPKGTTTVLPGCRTRLEFGGIWCGVAALRQSHRALTEGREF